jgi:hypothetical protein
LTQTAFETGRSVAITTFVINIALSTSLFLLWGMINGLQIIGHLPMFNVLMPANAEAFFSALLNLSDFKVIPTDYLMDSTVGEGNAPLFKKLGPIFLALFGFIVGLILVCVCKKVKWNNVYFSFIFNKLQMYIFFNGTIRYILEGELNLSLSSAL